MLALLYVLTPKFLILDRFLLGRGLYLTAREVREGPLSLRLKDVFIYSKDRPLGRFDGLYVSLSPSGIKARLTCGKSALSLDLSPSGGLRIKGENFECLKDYGLKLADLTVKDGIRGRLVLTDIKAGGFPLEELSLNFRGKVFDARLKALGQEGMGSGQVQGGRINGAVSVMGQSLVISGALENLRVERR